MNRRTKILAIGFSAVIAYLLVAQVVYPSWIRPLLTIDQRVAERRADLEKLEKMQKEVDDARLEYRDYVARVGSFDPGRVETAIRDRLNALIEKHKLENASTAPSRPVEDRKTGLTTSVITVTAVGSLESAIGFLKDISEVPELVRAGNPAIYPAGSGSKGSEKDLVNLRLPLEVLVLPKNKVAGPIDPATLPKSESFVRHDSARDYSEIWNRKPFTPYVELPPLRVDTQKMVNVDVGQPAFLQATATGGDGNYTFSWTPTDGVSEPAMPRSAIDTSAPRTQTYTVTVTDTVKDRLPITATVAVNIRQPPPVPVARTETPPPPPPPPPPVVRTWPDASSMQIVMTLLRSAGSSRTNELMVTNARTRETNYYKVTDEFDGGRLVFVHQTGGVVSRMGQYYVYPLGVPLSECMEYHQAENYPELKAAAERAVALETARAEAQRKNSSIDEKPVELKPTLDSHDGEKTAHNTIKNPADSASGATGPLAPVAGPESDEAATMGPPEAATQTPRTQSPPAQPGAQNQNHGNTPRPATNRQRPKSRNQGRL